MKKIIGFIILLHAGYSAYQFRKHVSESLTQEMYVPIDIIFETILGILFNFVFGVLDSGKFEDIRALSKPETPESAFARPNFKDYYNTRGNILRRSLEQTLKPFTSTRN